MDLVKHQHLNIVKFNVTDLLRRQVNCDPVQHPQDFIDEWFRLLRLENHEMASTFLSDLNERVTSHVLNTYCEFIRLRGSIIGYDIHPRVFRA